MADHGSTIPKDDASKGLDGMGSASKAEGSGQPSDTGESCPGGSQEQPQAQKECPPHDWEVVELGVTPDESIQKNLENAAGLKADKAEQARGYTFEADAIEKNKKRGIENASRKLRCKRCGAEQELDIVFKDGQIAECSSKKGENVRTGKREQAVREKDIQDQMNKQSGKKHKPLAKIDGSVPDATSGKNNSKAVFERRGYQVEVL